MITSDGMNIWESINHAMTGLGTGGFSVTDESIAPFGMASQLVVIVLMIFGAVAFSAHYELLNGRIRRFIADAQLRTMAVLIVIGVITLTLFLSLGSTFSSDVFAEMLGPAGFQFISALTCTGFASVSSLAAWSESSKLLLSFAMVIGGAAGSTAGGIKLFRAILLYKGVGWRIKRAISTPRRVFVHKLGDKSLSKDDAMDLINEAAIISFMWVIILMIGVVVLSLIFPSDTLGTVIFEVCSAQGNVGLTAGLTSINMDATSKIMLIINMWVGRLEIIPIVVLFRSFFGMRKNLI
jgi:trk system potassium uptake protein TrkH